MVYDKYLDNGSLSFLLFFFIKKEGSSFFIFLVYVDDVILASIDESLAAQFKSYLDSHFKLKT